MKPKYVTQQGAQVTVEYADGSQSIQNFDSATSASAYCRSHGNVRPKPAEKASAPKAPRKPAKKPKKKPAKK